MKSCSIRTSGRTIKAKTGGNAVSRTWKVLSGILLAVAALSTVLTIARSYARPQSGRQRTANSVPFDPKKIKVVPTPLSHIYMNFLLLQNHLDRVAAAREAQGKDGSSLRSHFQKELGFSDSQFTVVRGTAVRLEYELKEMHSESMGIVREDQQARIANPYQANVALPDLRLQDLHVQREQTIQRELDAMNAELGPAAAAKLKSFLETLVQRKNMPRPQVHPQFHKRLPSTLQSQPVHP